jgi:hypothetical protein
MLDERSSFHKNLDCRPCIEKKGGGALWKVLDVITTEVSGAALRTHHAVQSLNKKKKKEVTDCLL